MKKRKQEELGDNTIWIAPNWRLIGLNSTYITRDIPNSDVVFYTDFDKAVDAIIALGVNRNAAYAEVSGLILGYRIVGVIS
jgi:hypothetical protein